MLIRPLKKVKIINKFWRLRVKVPLTYSYTWGKMSAWKSRTLRSSQLQQPKRSLRVLSLRNGWTHLIDWHGWKYVPLTFLDWKKMIFLWSCPMKWKKNSKEKSNNICWKLAKELKLPNYKMKKMLMKHLKILKQVHNGLNF